MLKTSAKENVSECFVQYFLSIALCVVVRHYVGKLSCSLLSNTLCYNTPTIQLLHVMHVWSANRKNNLIIIMAIVLLHYQLISLDCHLAQPMILRKALIAPVQV